MVTPFTGVWIEIGGRPIDRMGRVGVTPFTGVWIEISRLERGYVSNVVTPFTGVWIEIDPCRLELFSVA